MAFFNLTRLGLQDPIKAALTRPGTTPAPGNQPGTATSTSGAQRTKLSEAVYPNSEANGSYVKYTERVHKHIRPKLGPNEIYHTQVTTNINYSYWMKDGVQHETWTQNEHHPRVNSEMTRFVDEMTLTNREFTLF